MSAVANCRLIGRWRIVEADIWDRAHLDLCGPATLTITARGDGTAELLDDATIEIEFSNDNCDDAVLKAKRDTSSKAC